VDQVTTVSTESAGDRSWAVAATSCFSHGLEAFGISTSGPLPIAAPTIAFTGPFDGCGRLSLSVGGVTSAPSSDATTWMPFAGEASVVVPMLGPTKITSFQLGNPAPVVSLADLEVTWSADPLAAWVRIELACSQLTWTVIAPASAGRFRFFSLSSSVSTRAFFPTGSCTASISGTSWSLHSYQDELSRQRNRFVDVREEVRESSESGDVLLQ
jgi:hypothetical protein